jgi:HK97 gp10 family phage protein
MARFDVELPNDLIKQFEALDVDAEKMLGNMTQAGAEVVYRNAMSNIPKSFKGSNIMKCLQKTKVYKTKSDDGINTKIAFYGYFINKRGVETPAPLVANVFEHGTSTVKKQPFMRKSFKKSEIEKAMLAEQERFLPKE